jgi:hypothetical protein
MKNVPESARKITSVIILIATILPVVRLLRFIALFFGRIFEKLPKCPV